MSNQEKKSHRKLVTSLLVVVVGAFGFGYALVPLYDVFCEITGFGGRTNTEAVTVAEAPDLDRESFRATLDGALEQVPHVRGVNNHMGSDLTQRRPQSCVRPAT